eukprot:SAG31_NODE_6634_length_1943_cov_1.889913_1_plen_398_part_00
MLLSMPPCRRLRTVLLVALLSLQWVSPAGAMAATAAPAVRYLDSYNQALNVQVSRSVSKGGTIVYLGSPEGGVESCAALCIGYTAARCWSFVYMKPEQKPGTKIAKNWELFPNTNNVFGRLISPSKPKDKSLHSLGKFETLAGCRRAVNNSDIKFMSYTYHHTSAPVGDFAGHCYGDTSTTWIAPAHPESRIDSGVAPGFPLDNGGGKRPLAGQCFAVTSPGFNPSYDTTAVSGIVDWPCRTADDCSLNGKCDVQSGECACRPAWKGRRCEQLNLLPPTRGAGYRGMDDGHNTSSWGGAVLKGECRLYENPRKRPRSRSHHGGFYRFCNFALNLPRRHCSGRSLPHVGCRNDGALRDRYVAAKLTSHPCDQPDARRGVHEKRRDLGGLLARARGRTR